MEYTIDGHRVGLPVGSTSIHPQSVVEVLRGLLKLRDG